MGKGTLRAGVFLLEKCSPDNTPSQPAAVARSALGVHFCIDGTAFKITSLSFQPQSLISYKQELGGWEEMGGK